MAARKKIQETFGTGKQKLAESVNNAKSKGGVPAKVLDAGQKGVRGAVKATAKVSGAAVSRATKFISFEKYRTELESALDEAMRVIATQEARIARLEEDLRNRDHGK
ncbi:MAG: hypothetical protein EBZ52_03895 [Actinobacteria bacterium]|nr:hypothetical protein [Actinomycetota bacterium]